MDTDQPDGPKDRWKQSGIIVQKYNLEVDDFAWATLSHLYIDDVSPEDNPGVPAHQERMFRLLANAYSHFGDVCVYANPVYLVWTDGPVAGFISKAKEAQREWFNQFKRIMDTSGRIKREMRRLSPITRQLTHTGVLFLQGRHVFPNAWPDDRDFPRPVG